MDKRSEENQTYSLKQYLKINRRDLSDYMLNCASAGVLSKVRVRAFAAVVKNMEDDLKYLFWRGFLTGSILVSILIYGIKVLWK